MAILIRWAAAFVLLALTYNPTQWNYVAWAQANGQERLPLAVLAALVLLVGYIIFLRATLRSIGALGMLLVAALFGALVWVLVDMGLLTLDDPRFATWLGLVALSLVLGVGLSWSIIRRRLSGQVDMDDVED